MRLRSVISVAMLTLSGFFGCGGSTGGTGSGSAGPVELADFSDVYANTFCDNLAGCCTSSGYGYDANKCKAVIKGFTSLLIELVNQGKVKYDAAAAGACMAEVPAYAKACLQGELESTACRNVFVGTVPQGGACTQSAECIEPPGGEADCDQGKCVPDARGGAGDACKQTCTEEGSTTYCSGGSAETGASCFTNDGLFCSSTTQKCEKRLTVGASGCDSGESSCVDGAYCDNQICAAQKAVGQPCTGYDQCVAVAYCDQTCLAKKPMGAACTDEFADEECIDGACDAQKCAKDKNTSMGTFCGATGS